MISKELLSEVLGDEYKDRLVDWFQVEDNYLRTYYDCGKYDLQGRPTGLGIEINIHELAYLCKEWAYKQGFLIGSNCSQGITVTDIDTHTVLNHFDVDIEDFTEFEIKACQWILEGTYMQTTKLT